MTYAEGVEHLHHAMTWDFRLVVVAITVNTLVLAWLIIGRRR